MRSLNFSQRIRYRCPAIAGQPVDRAFAYLEFTELGFVTPYGESYVRMEHESGG